MGLLSLLFGCDTSGPYRKKDGAWHFKNTALEGHPRSVTALNGTFARNDDGAWYRSTSVFGADGRTFVALDDHYAKDAARVYYGDTYRNAQEYWLVKRDRVVVIDSGRAASFIALRDGYAKDDRRVYHDGATFPVRDVASFEPLDYGFARDDVTAYYHQVPVPESDGRTFVVLDPSYAHDSTHAFFADIDLRANPPANVFVRLEGADPRTLTALLHDYAKDAHHVYHRGKRVAGADVATFAPIDISTDSADARDARGTFKEGKRR